MRRHFLYFSGPSRVGLLVFVGALAGLAGATGCVSSDKESSNVAAHSGASPDRDVAAENILDQPHLIFQVMEIRQAPRGIEIPVKKITEVYTPHRWANFPAQGNARRTKLSEFFFANTRARSRANNRNLACYTGTASEIENRFFKDQTFDKIKDLKISKSSDGLMMGMDFVVFDNNTWKPVHFRLSNCFASGKGYFFDPRELGASIQKQLALDSRSRQPQAEEPELPPQVSEKEFSAAISRRPAAAPGLLQEGYAMLDEITGAQAVGKIPRFQLRADYDKADQVHEKLPWREANLNLGDEAEAFRFAMLMKKYVYDGMANQSKNPSMNLIAQKSPRYWCHMPWLNQGSTGREAVHGLTQERDIEPSAMYPNPSPGSDWGTAVFNPQACQAIDRTFGPASNPRRPPQTPEEWHARTHSPDGSVIAKFLFTTAVFPAIEHAWQLIAHVSPPKSTSRALQPVRHIQLDIGIKDSTLRGVPVQNGDNWIMLTYYYDASYTDDEEIGTGLPVPEGVKHMRPLGLQWGFTKADSRIFRGGITNNPDGLLNGPADNAKSSCLGCHGTAGTPVRMAPGVTSTAQYMKFKSARKTLDFGQQFAFAKRNYETRSQMGGAAPAH